MLTLLLPPGSRPQPQRQCCHRLMLCLRLLQRRQRRQRLPLLCLVLCVT
jgi:hypothetical protein